MDREERDEIAKQAVSGVRTNHRGWARADCPFCLGRVGKDDRKACFGLNANNGKFHCFRCGIGGRLGGFDEIEFDGAVEDGPNAIVPPEGFEELAKPPLRGAMCAEPFLRVLRKRGVRDEMVAQLGIGACLEGVYRNRVVVPVKDDDGGWLWWVGRHLWDKRAKYRYPSGNREHVLFNHAALLVETDVPALVVEGVFDSMALWPDGVAVLGKPSESQIAAFAAARRPVVTVLDGDAWEEGWALGMRLKYERHDGRAGSVRLPPKVDPDEVVLGELYAAAGRSLNQIDPARI